MKQNGNFQCLKRINDLSIFKIKAIQRLSKADREELLRILKKVDETLVKNWQGYDGFDELQEKLVRLRTIIEEAPENDESAG